MTSPLFFFIVSMFSIAIPLKTTLTALGGYPNDFISIRCSFLRDWTFTIVASNISFASLTAASAISVNSSALLACFWASISSVCTIFYCSSAIF